MSSRFSTSWNPFQRIYIENIIDNHLRSMVRADSKVFIYLHIELDVFTEGQTFIDKSMSK